MKWWMNISTFTSQFYLNMTMQNLNMCHVIFLNTSYTRIKLPSAAIYETAKLTNILNKTINFNISYSSRILDNIQKESHERKASQLFRYNTFLVKLWLNMQNWVFLDHQYSSSINSFGSIRKSIQTKELKDKV